MSVREEDHIQEAGVQYLRAVLPENAYVVSHEKAGKRTELQAALLARRGILSGQPDMRIDWALGGKYAIEFKTKNGTLTRSQEIEFPKLARAGVEISICRSVADVHRALVHWGIGPLRHTSLSPEVRDMAWQARVAKKRAKQAATRRLTAEADAEAGVEPQRARPAFKPRARPTAAQIKRIAGMREGTMF